MGQLVRNHFVHHPRRRRCRLIEMNHVVGRRRHFANRTQCPTRCTVGAQHHSLSRCDDVSHWLIRHREWRRSPLHGGQQVGPGIAQPNPLLAVGATVTPSPLFIAVAAPATRRHVGDGVDTLRVEINAPLKILTRANYRIRERRKTGPQRAPVPSLRQQCHRPHAMPRTSRLAVLRRTCSRRAAGDCITDEELVASPGRAPTESAGPPDEATAGVSLRTTHGRLQITLRCALTNVSLNS